MSNVVKMSRTSREILASTCGFKVVDFNGIALVVTEGAEPYLTARKTIALHLGEEPTAEWRTLEEREARKKWLADLIEFEEKIWSEWKGAAESGAPVPLAGGDFWDSVFDRLADEIVRVKKALDERESELKSVIASRKKADVIDLSIYRAPSEKRQKEKENGIQTPPNDRPSLFKRVWDSIWAK
jgi:hypothetical protein